MSAFRFVGHLFIWIKNRRFFQRRWKRVKFDFRFGCNRDFHLLGEKVIIAFDIHIFDIWPLFVSHVIFKTWDDECLKVSYCVGESWSHEKLPVCASEFIPPKSLHLSVMHNAHFIRSSTRPLLYDFNAASSPSAQGTHATRPRCLTSPMERLSACLVELSTGALSTISYTDIQGSWRNMVSVNLSIFYPPIDDGLNCRYRCNEGVPMSGSESLYCDGNSWNGSVR